MQCCVVYRSFYYASKQHHFQLFFYRKLTLLKQIFKPLLQAHGYMILCKFNQLDPPDTIFLSGFDSFFKSVLLDGNDEVIQSMKSRIEEILGVRAV